MSSKEVLEEMKEIRAYWHRNDFQVESHIHKRYAELRKLRHARVRELYETDRVMFGPQS